MLKNPPSIHWFYVDPSGAVQGPLPMSGLEALAKNGTLTPQTLVCRERENKWVRLDLAVLPSLPPSTQEPPDSNSDPADPLPLLPPSLKGEKKVQEYRRTCQSCGKVWHSLLSREKEIESNIQHNSCMECGEAVSCCGDTAQANRNVAAQKGELSRLRQCPACQSANYKEEVLDFHEPDSQ